VSSALASRSGNALLGRSSVGVALLVLALPAFALRAWSSACADTLGERIAAWLVAIVPAPAFTPAGNSAGDPEPPLEDAPNVQGASFDAKRGRQTLRARGLAAPHGIRVSSAQVLALAARRAMPSAVYVKANALHPGGLLLSGVSALGVGLQDGDVLTDAAGQKASSVAAVVGVVLAARARQAAEISGRFYRGGVPFSLIVEQPYPKGFVPG